jgi:hypothetical protein
LFYFCWRTKDTMTTPSDPAKHHPSVFLQFSVLLCGLAIVYALYSPGFTAGFYYDDVDRLSPLTQLDSLDSFLFYIFAGETGPLGRPLAMASFLLHISDWPNNTQHIFTVNVLLHLINGLLLVWLINSTINLCSPALPRARALWIAIFTGLLWLSLPVLVSTSLIAIQRMTSLSATFSLLGLVVYLLGLQIQSIHPRRGVVLQATGLTFGVLLAVLAKENGLLLPVFALVIETTLFQRIPQLARHRRLRISLLALSLLVVLAYLTYRGMNGAAAYVIRDFTLTERMLTQPIVLWEYLRQGFFPRTLLLNPFHDDYLKAVGLLNPPTVLFALVSWVVLIFAAIRYRLRSPVFAFAVLWYLAGHLLESTVLPLELYFEHRNYLPMIGPAFALVWLAFNAPSPLGKMGPALLCLYMAILWMLLWQTTSLWGDRRLAAEIWHQVSPTSPRAALNLAAYHANELQDGLAALRVFDSTAQACPRCLDTRLMAMPLACRFETAIDLAKRREDILARINDPLPSSAPVVLLGRIARLRKEGTCMTFSLSDFEQMNHALLNNRKFTQWNGPHRGLYFNLYEIALSKGNVEQARAALLDAWDASPGLDIAALMVNLLAEQGKVQEARAFLAEAKTKAPANPVVAWLWARECDEHANKLPKITGTGAT